MIVEQGKQIAVKIPILVIPAKPTTTGVLKTNKPTPPTPSARLPFFPRWCLASRVHESRELWPRRALHDRLFSDSCVNHTKAPCADLTEPLCAWHCNLKLLCYSNTLKCTLYKTAGAATLLLEHGNASLRKTLRLVKELSKAARNHFQLLLCRYNLLSIPTFTCNGNRFAF